MKEINKIIICDFSGDAIERFEGEEADAFVEYHEEFGGHGRWDTLSNLYIFRQSRQVL